MSENNEEYDRPDLSSTDSLERAVATCSSGSLSSEDSLIKTGSNPQMSQDDTNNELVNGGSGVDLAGEKPNVDTNAASEAAVTSGGKKLVKQRSLIPQPVHRAFTIDDLSKSSNSINGAVSSGTGKEADGAKRKSRSRENLAHAQKQNGAINRRQCSLDYTTQNRNAEGLTTPGQVTSTSVSAKPSSGEIATPVKENLSSLRRKELAHRAHQASVSANDTEEYLTPLQRKDKLISELRVELRMAQTTIKERDEELEFIRNEQDAMVQEVVDQKNNCISELTKQLAEIHCAHDDLALSHEEALQTVAELKETIKRLEVRKSAEDLGIFTEMCVDEDTQ